MVSKPFLWLSMAVVAQLVKTIMTAESAIGIPFMIRPVIFLRVLFFIMNPPTKHKYYEQYYW
jgi:hypothetical protein